MRPSINLFVIAPVVLCWGLERLVRAASADVHIVGSALNLADASPGLSRGGIDVVVIDMDEVPYTDALHEVTRHYPVVLLVPEREKQNSERWIRAGVKAVVPKGESHRLLLCNVRTAFQRRYSGPRSATIRCEGVEGGAAQNPEQDRIATLTSREHQLVLAVIGNPSAAGKVLASKLCISEHTLRNHLTSIYRKLGVQNRLSLHAFAVRHHLEDGPASEALTRIPLGNGDILPVYGAAHGRFNERTLIHAYARSHAPPR